MKLKYWISSTISLCYLFMYAIFAAAEDEFENESEISPQATLIADIGIALFIISLIIGLIIFLNLQKPIQLVFRKIHMPMKIFYKIHHPFTISALFFCVLHGILVTQGGEDDGFLSGWTAVALLVILVVSGIMFSFIKPTNKARILIRILHLLLTLSVGISFIVHSGSVG